MAGGRALSRALQRKEQERLEHELGQAPLNKDQQEEEEEQVVLRFNPFEQLLQSQPSENSEDKRVSDKRVSDVSLSDKEMLETEKLNSTVGSHEEQESQIHSLTLNENENENESTRKKSMTRTPRRKKGLKRSKEKDKVEIDGDEMDEIDLAIKQINEKLGVPMPIAVENQTKDINLQDIDIITSKGYILLALNTHLLNWRKELEKEFGLEAVKGNFKVAGKGVKGGTRGLLVTRLATWPRFTTSASGLGMKRLSLNLYTLTISNDYIHQELGFYNAINTHNPAALHALHNSSPYHLNTLLQLCYISQDQGNMDISLDFTERIIHAFEMSCLTIRSLNILTGKVRLDYDRLENRAVFLALFHFLNIMARKGCWKTGLEYTKLLFSLDPISDPLCTLPLLAFFALKSSSYEWLATFWFEFRQSLDLTRYPSMAFSSAVAVWYREREANKKSSTEMLLSAIKSYPMAIVGLFTEMQVDASILEQTKFPVSHNDPTSVEALLIDLYVERAHSTWKVPELFSWLKDTISNNLEMRVQELLPVADDEFEYNAEAVYRFIILQDNKEFVKRVDSTLRAGCVMWDPVPPVTEEESVFDAFREVTGAKRRERQMSRKKGVLGLGWMGL